MFMRATNALKYLSAISFLSLIFNSQTCHSQQMVQASWDDGSNNGKLLHMTINENTGQVYIGAVNKIYQLSNDLKLEAQVSMGPMPDDYKCPASRDCPNIDKKVMDYYNKALVIFDPSLLPNIYPASNSYSSMPSFLISCGTLFQGSCALHTLDNIEQYTFPANESLVANSPNASTVVFIAPGPAEQQYQARQSPVLYIGSSYSGYGPYNQEVPAISSRSLSTESMFALAANNVASGTRLTVNALVRDRYPITYVHGFSSKGFSFFITVQRLSTSLPRPFITKLVRICQKDTNYHSYVEVPLKCKNSSLTGEEIDFNLAQAAYVARPGNLLAKELDISTKEEVLFVVFSKSADELDIYNQPSHQSALCIYPLQLIHRMFTANIQQCFNGNGEQGLDFVSSTVACEKSQWPINDDFCGTDMNNLINGLLPIETNPVISYNDVLLTSVAAEPSHDFTVAYLGTSNGRLKRVVVESDHTAIEYSDSPVDLTRNSAINPDMKFDRNSNFLYLMNEKRIFLIKTHECSIYKTSFDCRGAKDPHCGWCSVENRCTVKNSCAQAQQDSEYWLSFKSQSPADYSVKNAGQINFVSQTITSVSPSKGPVSGGTRLLIWGSYLNSGSKVEVFVGSFPCSVINRAQERIDCITSAASKSGGQAVSIRFDVIDLSFPDYHFLYVDDPVIESVTSPLNINAPLAKSSLRGLPPRGIPAGGIKIHVKGKNLNCIQEPMFYVILDGLKYKGPCQKENETEMNCQSPRVPEEKLSLFRIDEEPVELDYGFIMDNVQTVHNLATRRDNKLPMFLMYTNPDYKPFPEEVKLYKSDYLTINGSNLDRASSEFDVKVSIGDGFCNVTSLSRNQLTCKPPPLQPAALARTGQLNSNQLPDVVVTVGNSLNFTIGKISYDSSLGIHSIISKSALYMLFIGGGILIVFVIAIMVAYEKKRSESNRVVKTMQEQMDILEMKVASEAKQAFTELQTEITDLTDDLEHGGIPYLDYRIYAMKVLFPNQSDHPVLSETKEDSSINPNFNQGINAFHQLILNKTFLLLFIRTLESNKYFSMRDRVNVASLIMVTLQNKMEYCTDILKTLLAELIEKSMENRNHPKLLLRRTESVVEKMLSSWFTFLLNKFLRECAGEPLFLLYQAIKHQVNKGPVDAITGEARCSLSEEKLIRQSIDYKPMCVCISMSAQTAYLFGLNATQNETIEILVRVLDCDTISQVKEKAIDALYKSTPYSHRPQQEAFDLEWRPNQATLVTMSDEDHTTKTEGYWRKLNTLSHYRVPDGAYLMLVMKQNSIYNMSLAGNNSDKHRYETLNFNFIKSNSPPLNKANGNYKTWHLVHHHDNDYRDGERSAKMVSEIYLTRLLATKGTLQRFVDDLFETIFSTARLTSSLPIAIKYMFDFLDDQARQHGINDPDVVHTWKSNSLPLRFWVNLIKNPDFVFDINKSNIVDSCLSVVAQTFMDACSTSAHRLGKDSPSSKLLYAKDLPIYQDWVERYYSEIAVMPPINEHDMNAMLAEESRQHAHEFNITKSLHELYKYAAKHQAQLLLTLDDDEFACKFMLPSKFRQVILLMQENVDQQYL